MASVLDTMQNPTAEELAAVIVALEAKIAALTVKSDSLEQEVERLNGIIKCFQKRDFGRKSETALTLQLALDLFDDEKNPAEGQAEGQGEPSDKAGEAAPAEEEEAKAGEKKTRGRPKGSKSFGGIDNVVVIDHDDMSGIEGEYGPENLEEVGTKTVEKIVHTPGTVTLERHVIHIYKVKDQYTAEGNDLTVPNEEVPELVEGMAVTPSIFAYIFTEKFAKGVPLYRIEKALEGMGVTLSRQTMCRWFIQVTGIYLSLLVSLMAADLMGRSHIHGDETTIVCIEGEKEKGYMWMACSALWEAVQIVVYMYHDGREYDFAGEMYAGFEGTIVCDRYGAYAALKAASGGKVKLQFCFDHVRRRVVEALEADPLKAEYQKLGTRKERDEFLAAHEGFAMKLGFLSRLDKIYMLERKFKEMSPEERARHRKEESKPLMEELREFLEKAAEAFSPKVKMGEAVRYMLDDFDGFCTFLDDPCVEISNARGERAIKDFVIGRKNWLFATSKEGADCCADAYSLVETAKRNGLKIYDYIVYVLEEMMAMESPSVEKLRRLLPYSKELPERLFVKKTSE